ncbi:MAG: DNA recombination protein RmuC [Candidatus Omnitrophica bacterium]|nr:DNA recombination protein RmuC [Candidatus Omnitrophota bacterium]
MVYSLFLLAGLALGVGLYFLISLKLFQRVKETFDSLSLKALRENSEQYLTLARENLARETQAGRQALEEKKKLIDQSLVQMAHELEQKLEKVHGAVTSLEKSGRQTFGALDQQIKSAMEQTGRLQETTGELREALTSTKARGQWGERMAEDVLRLAGFIENVNYYKEKALETGSGRPDYCFLLPQGLKVNMDVKFPLDNYLRYLEEKGELAKERLKEQFLRDVRNRIKEVTTRDYINPDEKTLEFCIVFIPNEQVYGFINESDRSILDEALKNRVVVCSPLTLYAILAVIRKAVDNFRLGETAGKIVTLLSSFAKQWERFIASFDAMGKKLGEAQEEYDRLLSTRRNQLEKVLRRVEDLRQEQGIPGEVPPDEIVPIERAEIVERES